MQGKLYRSRGTRIIAGVCGGLAEALGLEVVLVRLFFLLLFFANGMGLLAYLALWVVMPYPDQSNLPLEARVHAGADEIAEQARGLGSELKTVQGSSQVRLLVGGALILFGLVFLVETLNIPGLGWIDTDLVWPVLLIIGGAALLWRRGKGAPQ